MYRKPVKICVYSVRHQHERFSFVVCVCVSGVTDTFFFGGGGGGERGQTFMGGGGGGGGGQEAGIAMKGAQSKVKWRGAMVCVCALFTNILYVRSISCKLFSGIYSHDEYFVTLDHMIYVYILYLRRL